MCPFAVTSVIRSTGFSERVAEKYPPANIRTAAAAAPAYRSTRRKRLLRIFACSRSNPFRIFSGEGLSRPVRLCPDQKFTQNVLQGEFSIEQVDARNYCQWFEERLVFYNMPLTDIMVNLERKYHVEIVLSSSLPANKRLSLVVQHEPLEDIMEVISRLMPVRCQIDGDRVFVTSRSGSR